ncbi:hypothetical protein [Streptomyces sp. R35]|uniref:Uncharacterized protein n=1 Tax=Streptomyces sp. R35 TaxID=3238630 RepID=A0AB39RWK6_9ACTN
MAQLYLRDIPLLRPPGQADLLQVLWCPYDHDPDYKPATAVFWRSAATVVDVLATPPEPYEANYPGYVPEPCLLAPEAITEYPNSLDLSPEMRLAVGDWSRWQAASAGLAQEPREALDRRRCGSFGLANPFLQQGSLPQVAHDQHMPPEQRHRAGIG